MKKIFTIGFSGKSLEEFIDLLRENNVQKIVDIRLNPASQLSGFAKGRDLKFVLSLFNIDYEHIIELAPTKSALKEYRKNKNWQEYELKYNKLMMERGGGNIVKRLLNEGKNICLLCSEVKPEMCHRKLVTELLKETIEIIHL